MNADAKVSLAEELAKEMQGKINRNEFSRWMDYLKLKGSLAEAITLARHLARSEMLRGRQRQSYSTLASAIEHRSGQLESLPLQDLMEVLGYTRRFLSPRGSRPRVERRQRPRGRGGGRESGRRARW